MPKKVRVDRSAFTKKTCFAKGHFVGKIGGKSGLHKTNVVKNCENSVFRVIFVFKQEEWLGSGPFPRDGRVTGNQDPFL